MSLGECPLATMKADELKEVISLHISKAEALAERMHGTYASTTRRLNDYKNLVKEIDEHLTRATELLSYTNGEFD